MQILAVSIDWLNYPGLELWKFADLAIFLGVVIFIVRRPLSEALRTRRERIRQELLKAEEERNQALARLSEAEALLARVDEEARHLREQAHREAELELQRLSEVTEREIAKLNLQAERELQTARRVEWKTLREFLAQRSVQLAAKSVRDRIGPEEDARLINTSIRELRRSRG